MKLENHAAIKQCIQIPSPRSQKTGARQRASPSTGSVLFAAAGDGAGAWARHLPTRKSSRRKKPETETEHRTGRRRCPRHLTNHSPSPEPFEPEGTEPRGVPRLSPPTRVANAYQVGEAAASSTAYKRPNLLIFGREEPPKLRLCTFMGSFGLRSQRREGNTPQRRGRTAPNDRFFMQANVSNFTRDEPNVVNFARAHEREPIKSKGDNGVCVNQDVDASRTAISAGARQQLVAIQGLFSKIGLPLLHKLTGNSAELLAKIFQPLGEISSTRNSQKLKNHPRRQIWKVDSDEESQLL